MLRMKRRVWVLVVLVSVGTVGVFSGQKDRAPGPKEPAAGLQPAAESVPAAAAGSASSAAFNPAGAVVQQDGIPPRRRLSRAFQKFTRDQVPTGILLDKGAISAKKLIARQDGSGKAAPMSRFETVNAYGDLVNSTVGLELPSRAAMAEKARVWREKQHATPVSLMVIDYNSITGDHGADLRVDETGVFQPPAGRLEQSGRYIAAAAQADTLNYYNPTLVIASDLFVSNAAASDALENISVRFAGAEPQPVVFDTPFQPSSLPQESGYYVLAVAFSLDQAVYSAKAIVKYTGPGPRNRSGTILTRVF